MRVEKSREQRHQLAPVLTYSRNERVEHRPDGSPARSVRRVEPHVPARARASADLFFRRPSFHRVPARIVVAFCFLFSGYPVAFIAGP